MTLYVVRHGWTEYNEKRLFCGRSDIPLAAEGEAQLPALRDAASTLGLAAVYSSPLRRALVTASAVAEGAGLPVLTDGRLVERDFGEFEGTNFDAGGDMLYRGNFACRYPGGESNFDVVARVYPFLDELREKYIGKNVAIVTHGFVCSVIRTYCEDVTDRELYTFFHPNGEIIRYEVGSRK